MTAAYNLGVVMHAVRNWHIEGIAGDNSGGFLLFHGPTNAKEAVPNLSWCFRPPLPTNEESISKLETHASATEPVTRNYHIFNGLLEPRYPYHVNTHRGHFCAAISRRMDQ